MSFLNQFITQPSLIPNGNGMAPASIAAGVAPIFPTPGSGGSAISGAGIQHPAGAPTQAGVPAGTGQPTAASPMAPAGLSDLLKNPQLAKLFQSSTPSVPTVGSGLAGDYSQGVNVYGSTPAGPAQDAGAGGSMMSGLGSWFSGLFS
jgi:hypothetical protein